MNKKYFIVSKEIMENLPLTDEKFRPRDVDHCMSMLEEAVVRGEISPSWVEQVYEACSKHQPVFIDKNPVTGQWDFFTMPSGTRKDLSNILVPQKRSRRLKEMNHYIHYVEASGKNFGVGRNKAQAYYDHKRTWDHAMAVHAAALKWSEDRIFNLEKENHRLRKCLSKKNVDEAYALTTSAPKRPIKREQIGVACVTHDLTHNIVCGYCYDNLVHEVEEYKYALNLIFEHRGLNFIFQNTWLYIILKPIKEFFEKLHHAEPNPNNRAISALVSASEHCLSNLDRAYSRMSKYVKFVHEPTPPEVYPDNGPLNDSTVH